jgi:hypothetical protein
MLYNGRESSPRKLVWVEGRGVAGWGCSECAWVFNPSGPLTGKTTLGEMAQNLEVQLCEEFASHDCPKHPRVKGAKSPNPVQL